MFSRIHGKEAHVPSDYEATVPALIWGLRLALSDTNKQIPYLT